MRTNQLYAKASMCYFGYDSIEYFGHIISAKGLHTDSKKKQALENWPVPQNVKQLRSFLGLIGYCRRFVQGYGQMAKPLTKLLKKGSYQWNEKAQMAFERL